MKDVVCKLIKDHFSLTLQSDLPLFLSHIFTCSMEGSKSVIRKYAQK